MDKEKPRIRCPQCQQLFAYRKNKIFCSRKCGFKNWAKKHPRVAIEEKENV